MVGGGAITESERLGHAALWFCGRMSAKLQRTAEDGVDDSRPSLPSPVTMAGVSVDRCSGGVQCMARATTATATRRLFVEAEATMWGRAHGRFEVRTDVHATLLASWSLADEATSCLTVQLASDLQQTSPSHQHLFTISQLLSTSVGRNSSIFLPSTDSALDCVQILASCKLPFSRFPLHIPRLPLPQDGRLRRSRGQGPPVLCHVQFERRGGTVSCPLGLTSQRPP